MERIKINARNKMDYASLKEKLAKVDVAAIGHYTEFGFLHPDIRAMNPHTGKVAGPAFTVRIPAQDSKAVHLAVSMAQEGDILVIDRCHDKTHACVGEVVALCAKVRKLSALVVDGPITDIEQIKEIGIPVYATGISGMTTKFIECCGEINEDISCGGVCIHPGDLILADQNGVVALRAFEAERLIDEAVADQNQEAEEKAAICSGVTLQQLYAPEYATQIDQL